MKLRSSQSLIYINNFIICYAISFRLAKCDCTPLLSLLGNHKEVTKWNVSKFLRILEAEVKSLIQVVYGAVKVCSHSVFLYLTFLTSLYYPTSRRWKEWREASIPSQGSRFKKNRRLTPRKSKIATLQETPGE